MEFKKNYLMKKTLLGLVFVALPMLVSPKLTFQTILMMKISQTGLFMIKMETVTTGKLLI